jgi:hypothetical membrane protein
MDNLETMWNGNLVRPTLYCILRGFQQGRGPALAGIVGPVLFWTVLLILGQTQPDYNAFRYDISLLALGAVGWAQTANFIIFGLLIMAFQGGLQRAVAPGRAWGPSNVLALASGAALVAIAIFPTDPPDTWTAHGTVHLGIVAVLAVLLPIVCLVMAGKVRHHPTWRRYTRFSILTGALTGVLTLVLLLAWGGAWRVLHPWIGLYERAVFAVPSAWMGVMAIHLMKNSSTDDLSVATDSQHTA